LSVILLRVIDQRLCQRTEQRPCRIGCP
jgi:hypothetical protein